MVILENISKLIAGLTTKESKYMDFQSPQMKLKKKTRGILLRNAFSIIHLSTSITMFYLDDLFRLPVAPRTTPGCTTEEKEEGSRDRPKFECLN